MDSNPIAYAASRVEHHVAAYHKAVMGAALTSVVRVTIPGNPSKAPTGVKSPTKKDVAILRQRIRANILGNGILPSAVPNVHGEPVNFQFSDGSPSPIPLVLNRARRSAAHTLTSPQAVISHLQATTRFRRVKSVRLRERKKGGPAAFVTAAAWRGAARILANRAGNFVAGWSAAASAIGSTAVARTVLAGGAYSRSGTAHASATELAATNSAAPSPDLRRYQQSYLRGRLDSETAYFRQRFQKFMLAAIKKDLKK